MKKTSRIYPDGKYTVINRHGAKTIVRVDKGRVFIVGSGLSGGQIVSTLEQLEKKGCRIEAVA